MIHPNVSIVDLAPAEWERLSRRCFRPMGRQIQILRRGTTVLSSVGPPDVVIPPCTMEHGQLADWCAATRTACAVDRVAVFDADAVARLSRTLVAESNQHATQGDLLLRSATLVATDDGIVSDPPYLPSSLEPLIAEVRSDDGWVLVVCLGGDLDDALVEWTVLAEFRAGAIVTLSTADRVSTRRPPEVTVDQLVAAVRAVVPVTRAVVGTWSAFESALSGDDPLTAVQKLVVDP